jgi:acyl-coenzyme A thioesterase PaaI-like protein
MNNLSIQEQYAPHNACYGCGPANDLGLKLRSFILSDRSGLIAHWEPKTCYEAFPGILCGGTIGTLLDCHCNWTAAWYLMRNKDLTHPPCTVTAEYTIKLLRPTPTDGLIELSSHIIDSTENRATIGGTLTADGKVCATCEGVFVAVEEGHPAYHRW